MQTKNCLMLCRMADDSVVVIKFQPVKASNGVEDKTGMTLHLIVVKYERCQKRSYLQRDEVQKKIIGGSERGFQ